MFLELLLLVGVVCLLDFWVKKPKNDLMKNISSVANVPVLGSIFDLATFYPENLHLKFGEYCDRYGKSFRAWFLGNLIVVTADPKYIDPILRSKRHISKNLLYSQLKPWLGNGLLLSDGKKWQTMRKIITPTFHSQILEQFVEVFDQQSVLLVEKLRANAVGEMAFDVYPLIGLATLDIIAETAMGVKINAQMNSTSEFVQAVNDVTSILALRFMRPHLVFINLFKMLAPQLYKKQREGIAVMHEFTEKIIDERRIALENAAATTTDDISFGRKKPMALLDVLLQSTIDGEPLTDQEISQEVNTFMFEGHDTTTSAISFALFLLSRHEEVQQKLFLEIRELFGDNPHKRPITYHDLQGMSYMNCVVKESLRLFPSVPAIGRYVKEDFQIDDTTLPAETNVIILLWQVLRDPSIYPEPTLFKPERHLVENTGTSLLNNIVFSAGPRNCVGQRFAHLEIKCLLTKILQNFELLPLGEKVQPSINIVLRSKTGVNIAIKQRIY